MTDEERKRALLRIRRDAEETDAAARRTRDDAEDMASRLRETSKKAKDEEDAAEEANRLAFPPDVSLRVSAGSDVAAAQKLFPAAKQLLFRAINMKQAGVPVVKLFQPGTDGSLIYVFLIEGLKHVYVQPGSVPVPVEKEVITEQQILAQACPDVLSGVVYPGEPVVVSVDPVTEIAQYAVHEFHPSPISSELYDLAFAWQDVERLGIESDPAVSAEVMQVRYPKPSMYSGAMKRIVQAMYGVGKTVYVDNATPEFTTDFDVQNHYHYRWLKTDGIFKFNDEFWLIRISKDDGVLAQRLGLFECTAVDGFADALLDIGDTETYAIVNEFGGLPTGDDFPEDLEAAIENGGVLRLLTVDQLLPFYRDVNLGIDKNAFFSGCGWAFSDSGAATSAHNTCWWYSRPDIVAKPFYDWATDGFAEASPFDRYMRSEHWKVELSFSVDVEGNVSATAELTMVDEQPFEAPNSTWLIDLDEDSPMYGKKIGHYPVTGATGRAGSGGELTYPVSTDNEAITSGMLRASGMDPLRFFGNFTPLLRVGEPSAVQADYLCHSSFMAVPRDDSGDRLDRFKFWGRSQTDIRMVDIEPSYEAPVLVFYSGEELEIVRRKADRYVSDRETEAATDVTPGVYYPGDFFGTSLNLLDPISTSIETSPGTVANTTAPTGSYAGTPQFAAVGLIVPSGCREGYVFVKVSYDQTKLTGVGAETTSYVGFFSDLGVVTLQEYVSDHGDTYTVPNFGTFTIGEYELSVVPGWWSMWTNTYFDWNLGISGIGFRYAASISATSEKLAIHAEPQLGWRLLDVPWTYRNYSGMAPSLAGLPPAYQYELPAGISLENVNPMDITFIGAV